MCGPQSLAAAILPQIKWSGLDWGKARAAVRQSEAQRDTAQAQYRRPSSRRWRMPRAACRALAGRAASGPSGTGEGCPPQRGAGSATFRGRDGIGLEQIDRENARLQAGLQLAQARAELVVDFIAVNKALGLGWQE
jgi:outer membrane protein TolC